MSEAAFFGYDPEAIDQLNKEHPWTTNAKFVQNCKISALAAMKMLKHALSGVAKGKAAQGIPLEVTGLLIGMPQGNTIIVTDVVPMPEHKASSKALYDSVSKCRKESFVGWYHSHPHDVGAHPRWFLSNSDVSNQTLFQNTQPLWTAIVIDPLRSVAKQVPELGVFRVLPNSVPDQKVMPDGKPPPSEEAAILRWHDAWRRYYVVKHTFFMSNLSSSFLKIMSRNSLWIRSLVSENVMDKEYRKAVPSRIEESVKGLRKVGTSSRVRREGKTKDENTASQAFSELASEQCISHASTIAKQIIFNLAQTDSETKSSS